MSLAHPAIPSPKEQRLPVAENLFKTALLLALLLASFYGADRAVSALDAAALPGAESLLAKTAVVLSLALVNGILLMGLGALAHDSIHRAFLPSRFWNDLLGGTLTALLLIPFYANRQFHLTHHRHAHQPGRDPEEAMNRHGFLYAATAGQLVALNAHGRIWLANFRQRRDARYAGRAWKDLGFMATASAIYFGLVPALGISVFVSVLPAMPAFMLVAAFRGLADHYGVPPVLRATQNAGAAQNDERRLDRDEEPDSAQRGPRQREAVAWIVLTPAWLQWLWSHVNYHEVHHKYPYLSHRHLPQAYAATRDTLPYRVVRGYWRLLWRQRKLSYHSAPESTK
jgi:fatty acid desaturase